MPEIKPIIHSIINPIINSNINTIGSIGDVSLILDKTSDIDSVINKYGGSYTRSSPMWVPDFDGIYHEIPNDYYGLAGSRIVGNKLTNSSDVSGSGWTSTANMDVDALDTDGFNKLTYLSTSSCTVRSTLNGTYPVVSDGTFGLTTITVSSTAKLYSVEATSTSGHKFVFRAIMKSGTSDKVQIYFYELSASGVVLFYFADGNETGTAYVKNPQIEDVTGQANQNPSEYIATTTGAGTACFNTENGNTVDPVTHIVTEATGDILTNLIEYASWSESTNELSSGAYRTFTTAAGWATQTASLSKIAIGVDGFPNMATIISDTSAVASQEVGGSYVVTNDSKDNAVSFMIKRTTDAHYAGLSIGLTGGTALEESIIFDTVTGGITEVSSDGDYCSWYSGDFWHVNVNVKNNSTGNTTLTSSLKPAISSNGTTVDVSAQGSITVDWAQRVIDDTCCSPWVVEGGTTMAAGQLTLASAANRPKLLKENKSSVYAEYDYIHPTSHNGYEMIIDFSGVGHFTSMLQAHILDSRSSDGTTALTLTNLQQYNKSASFWYDSTKELSSNELNASGAYDGTWGSDDLFCCHSGGYYNFRGGLSKLIFSKDPYDAAHWLTETADADDVIPIGYEQVYDANGDPVYDENGYKVYSRRT